MIQLIIYALIAAGIAFGAHEAWDGFTGKYIREGAEQQMAADAVILKKANARADLAEQERADALNDAQSAKDAAQRQSDAIAAANQLAEQARNAARTQAIAYAKEKALNEQRIKALQAAAAATPKTGQSCEALLTTTDQILRESARERSQP